MITTLIILTILVLILFLVFYFLWLREINKQQNKYCNKKWHSYYFIKEDNNYKYYECVVCKKQYIENK